MTDHKTDHTAEARPAAAGDDSGWIFHFAEAARWAAATPGAYRGGKLCETDGFIHCSTAAQLVETARLHLAGRDDLLLITIDIRRLGPLLRWERSRGGQLFPHIYGPLPSVAVVRADPLPLDAAGHHLFPAHTGVGP
ncbi:DUF952 domain-containing protein [Tistrella bauzanensis]|jgi:uncharacterized protein (DUF952 family)|uniref:DUF952 domain-containing protein n=1 Tax=Tistrella arctica TaxID=3133430 RepID=A0ABU9YGM0_9PROT